MVFDDVRWGEQGNRPLEDITDKTRTALVGVDASKQKYLLGPYYIDDANQARVDLLPNTISTRLLNCQVDMTVVKKVIGVAGGRRTTFHCTRMMTKEIPKVAAWSRRFADELLEEDEDDLPFARNDLMLARETGELLSAGGSSQQLRELSAL